MTLKIEKIELVKKIELAKLNILREKPLLAPLVAKLKLIENNKIETAGLEYKTKTIHYNSEFFSKLDNKMKVAVLFHEVLHYLFIHDASKIKNKQDFIYFNLATDSIINYIIEKELKVSMREKGVTFDTIRALSVELSKYSDEELITFDHITILKALKKDNEALQQALQNILQRLQQSNNQASSMPLSSSNQSQQNNSSNNQSNQQSDQSTSDDDTYNNNIDNSDQQSDQSSDSSNNDDYQKDKDVDIIEEELKKAFGNRLSEEQLEQLKESIKDALKQYEQLKQQMNERELKELEKEVREALEQGRILERQMKKRGEEKGTLEELLDIILRRKRRNWRRVLRDTMSEIRSIAKDYDLTRASIKTVIIKRTFNVDTYIASLKKESESVKVVILIDVSGSISDKEYREFVNEVYNLMKDINIKDSYVVLFDADVQKVIKIKNGWNKEIFEELKIRKGFGGTVITTAIKKARELVKNRVKNTYLIAFTDGYTEEIKRDLVKDFKKVVFILTEDHNKDSLKQIEALKNVVISSLDDF